MMIDPFVAIVTLSYLFLSVFYFSASVSISAFSLHIYCSLHIWSTVTMVGPDRKPCAGKQGLEVRMTVALPPAPVMLPALMSSSAPVSAFWFHSTDQNGCAHTRSLNLCFVEPKLYKKLYAWSCHSKHAHSCVFDQNHISQMYAESHLSEFVVTFWCGAENKYVLRTELRICWKQK